MRDLVKGAVSALVLSLALTSAAEAQLTPATPPECSVSDIAPPATACSGAWEGNFKNLDHTTDFQDEISSLTGGQTGWSLSDDADVPEENTTGTIYLDPPLGNFVLALRAANAFSLYWFEGDVDQLAWSTDGVAVNNQDMAQALSGWGIYTNEETRVPEPGSMLLLTTGLFGIAVLRRRREDVA